MKLRISGKTHLNVKELTVTSVEYAYTGAAPYTGGCKIDGTTVHIAQN